MSIVSYVCTGNICRSVLGMFLFRRYCILNDIKDIEIRGYGMRESAGGEKPPKFIRDALAKYGWITQAKIDSSIEESDLVLCFVASHIPKLIYSCNAKHIKEFASYYPFKGISVPDPYFDKSVTLEICKMLESTHENIIKVLQ